MNTWHGAMRGVGLVLSPSGRSSRCGGYLPLLCGGPLPLLCGGHLPLLCGGYLPLLCGGYLPLLYGGCTSVRPLLRVPTCGVNRDFIWIVVEGTGVPVWDTPRESETRWWPLRHGGGH